MATTTTDDHKELVHDYLAAWDEADAAAVGDVLGDDFSFTHEGDELDVDAFQELMAGYFEALADPGHEMHDLVAENDTVVARITYTGVHDGELHGIEPTGNRIAVEEYLTFYVEDGEIVGLHALSDELELLRQLGVDLAV